jgi:hypothetical protein
VSKSRNSPWLGVTLTGRVKHVLVGGELWAPDAKPAAPRGTRLADVAKSEPVATAPPAAPKKSVSVPKPKRAPAKVAASTPRLPNRPSSARPPRAGLGHRRNKQ